MWAARLSVRDVALVGLGALAGALARWLAHHLRRQARTSSSLSLRLRSLPPSTLYAGTHALAPLMKSEGMLVLSGGVPPAASFPLRGISVCAVHPPSSPDARHAVRTARHGNKARSSAPAAQTELVELPLSSEEVALSQRYAPFAWDTLSQWLELHVQALHSPPAHAEHRTCITAGSMSGVEMLASMLIDRGDVVLMEERTFMAAIDVFRSMGAVLVPVAVDSAGLVPDSLAAACASLAARGVTPKLLYTVPVGQNPTGSRLAAERYELIYSIAAANRLLIMEDDAYFYMQHRADAPQLPLPGLQGLGPSFLSIDTKGIVLRLDTFSKLLAPGFRVGWLTAPRRSRPGTHLPAAASTLANRMPRQARLCVHL